MLTNIHKYSQMLTSVASMATGVTTTDRPGQSFKIILFRMAGRPDGRLDSDNNATQPAGLGLGWAWQLIQLIKLIKMK